MPFFLTTIISVSLLNSFTIGIFAESYTNHLEQIELNGTLSDDIIQGYKTYDLILG